MRLTTVEFSGEAMTLGSQDGGVMVAIPIRIQCSKYRGLIDGVGGLRDSQQRFNFCPHMGHH
jgi:hypothetical protein